VEFFTTMFPIRVFVCWILGLSLLHAAQPNLPLKHLELFNYDFFTQCDTYPPILYGQDFDFAADFPIPGSNLAASVAGGLRTEGRWFVDPSGRKVLLRGVNSSRRKLEDLELLQKWGFNLIRVVLYWDDYETADGVFDESYLDGLVTYLDAARDRGLYVILDLHQWFLSSAFDLPSIGFLESLGLTLWKVPSGEITHLAYLRKIGSLGGRVILSTGMATLAEIGAALDVLSKSGTPRENVTVLQCHTEYPTAFADANIRAMDTIARAFGVAVGFSDHTPGIEASVAAVALGATIIEKHLTLDKNLPGPDHAASLVPAEMAALVSAVRNVEKALGDGVKAPTPAEERNRLAARKSLVAARAVRKGEPFTPENVIAKRPGTGVSPMEADRWMGRVATRDYEPDEPL